MARRMLIDATHPEETRVVVLNGNRLEEFDFETSTKKQIKGNIYLAKITRVEPSLQAAFVEYGGNRHGFLAFSEIHPDYYRIPVSDREAMLAEERAAHDEDEHGYNGDLSHAPQPDYQPDFTAEHGEGDESHDASAEEGPAFDAEPPHHQATDEGLSPATQYASIEVEAETIATSVEEVVVIDGASAEAEADSAETHPVQSYGSPAEVESSTTSVVEVHDEHVPVETVGGDEFEEVQARRGSGTTATTRSRKSSSAGRSC